MKKGLSIKLFQKTYLLKNDETKQPRLHRVELKAKQEASHRLHPASFGKGN